MIKIKVKKLTKLKNTEGAADFIKEMQSDLFRNMRTTVGNYLVNEVVEMIEDPDDLNFAKEELRMTEKYSEIETTISDGLFTKTESLSGECEIMADNTIKLKRNNDFLEQDLNETLAEIEKNQQEIKHIRV